MKIRDLVTNWGRPDLKERITKHVDLKLRVGDVAKLAALAELYNRHEAELISDLLQAALEEVEEAFPYVEGSKIIARDEEGDPIYEDSGLTPRFQSLTKKHLQENEGFQTSA